MPPGRRKASGPAATAAPSNDPPPGSRPTRSSRRNPPPAEAEPPPPVRRPSNTEDAVGFAPLASLQSNRAARGRNQPAAPVALQNVQQIQQTPIRSRITPLHFPPTPGRAAANRLLSRLNQQAQMASPGPPTRNRSDNESDPESGDDSDGDGAPPPVRVRPMLPLYVDESDDEQPIPSVPTRSRGRRAANQEHQGPWMGYRIDSDKYAWAGSEVLGANTKSADCQGFFGQHTEHHGYKCALCPQIYTSGSSLTTRRRHLAKEHLEDYLSFIAQNNLPNKLPDALRKQRQEQRARDSQRIPFSIEVFEEQLIAVIVSNDLSINLIENREFRDLILLLRESLQDSDIPHRTKLRSLILDAWLKYYDKLKHELKGSIGKLSFTLDIWSSKGMQPYISLTVHWLGRKGDEAQLLLRQALLAFRRVRGSHSGERLARIVFDICEKADIVEKIGHFTMDNASNNGTFMLHLSFLLAEKGVLDFDPEKNYIRCFSHIINICSQAVIKAMEKEDSLDEYPETDTETESDDDNPGQTIRARRKAGPVRRARKTAAFIRKSGQRRDELLEIIQEGNEKKLWTELRIGAETPDSVVVSLSEVTVVLDVKTRWDSVFYMLRRLRYLQQPIIQFFVRNKDARYFRHPLESRDWNRLEILELILQQPHTVQTIMSAENTPVLAATIPAFELFMSSWESMLDDSDLEDENVAQIISPGLDIAKKYYNKFADTDAYLIAMFINPSIRFEWMRNNWSFEDQEFARKIILEKIQSYRDQDIENPVSRSSSATGSAGNSRPGSRPSSRSRTPVAVPTMLLQAARKYRNVQQALDFSATTASSPGNSWTAEDEMKSYMQGPIPSPQTTDMIGYWANHGITTWPTIYRMFVDYAPIQATSVPSERVFSSSAETDTKRRNRMGSYLMEALQMLKFNYKKSRLNFVADWQSAPIADDEEDWLRQLASTDETEQQEARQALTESFEMTDSFTVRMPEDETSM